MSLQVTFNPGGVCFGCGPANPQGLRIQSFVEDDTVVLRYTPTSHHLAFEGAVNGGIIGTLFDCHCNWTAAYYLMRSKGLNRPPTTVTADFRILLEGVTPMGTELVIRARPVRIEQDRAEIEAELEADGKRTVTCWGTFVAVEDAYPACES
jgi:acyl-coenzyme A thioesterase PaaI-like protein